MSDTTTQAAEPIHVYLAHSGKNPGVNAIAALGVKTSFQQLAALGWRPVLMLVVDTVFLACLILGGLMLQR